MKITVKASGGFAGLEENQVAQVDTSTLPTALRQRIEEKVARLFTDEPVIGTDMMQYHIDIDDQGKLREITVMDEGDPQSAIQGLLMDLNDT